MPETPKLPLVGKTVLITRRREDAEKWAEEMAALGAEAIPYPMIDTRRVMDRLPDISAYDGLALTSPTAARYFLELLAGSQLPDGLEIVTVGRETKRALAEAGIRSQTPPFAHGARELAIWLPEIFEAEALVLYLSARVTAADLRKLVMPSGIVLHRETLYETVATEPAALPAISDRRIDYVVFTSPSTVKHFFKIHRMLPPGSRAVSIGRTTATALKTAGVGDVLTAKHPNVFEVTKVMQ